MQPSDTGGPPSIGPGEGAALSALFSGAVAMIAALLNWRYNKTRDSQTAKSADKGHELQSFTAINTAARELMDEMRTERDLAKRERAVAIAEVIELEQKLDSLSDTKARVEVSCAHLELQLAHSNRMYEEQREKCDEWSRQNAQLLAQNEMLLAQVNDLTIELVELKEEKR